MVCSFDPPSNLIMQIIMSNPPPERSASLPVQAIELAMSVPQVVALRLVNPSIDHLEFYRMWSEKFMAYGESFSAMSNEVINYQNTMLATCCRYWSNPWILAEISPRSSLMHTAAFGEKVARKGLAPMHKRTLANARRLTDANVK